MSISSPPLIARTQNIMASRRYIASVAGQYDALLHAGTAGVANVVRVISSDAGRQTMMSSSSFLGNSSSKYP
jgi:hypothetical protein